MFFKDLFNSKTGKIHITINPNMMGSDEAILAVMKHELHELALFRNLFRKHGGTLRFETFVDEAMDGIPHNFHWQAWEAADDLILRLRGR